ncbi:MAG: YqgE/AlgH family protein [Bacteroidota bacterium]
MKHKIATGKILLAEPFMIDPNFKRSVVCVCDHTKEDGTVGFVLNKNLGLQVNELILEFPDFDAEVYYGGPVQTDSIHYIHSAGDILDNSTPVVDGVWWGGDFEKLKFLIASSLIEPKDIRFFVGYSGWSPGQLDNEMEHGSWVVTDMYANYLFKSKPDSLWQQVMKNKGDRFEVIADMPDGVNWN